MNVLERAIKDGNGWEVRLCHSGSLPAIQYKHFYFEIWPSSKNKCWPYLVDISGREHYEYANKISRSKTRYLWRKHILPTMKRLKQEYYISQKYPKK